MRLSRGGISSSIPVALMKRGIPVGIIAVLLLAGCASVPPAQVGQTAGALAGGAIAPGIGAPVGALVGLLAGLVVQGQVDKATEKRERKDLGRELGTVSNRAAAATPLPGGPPVRVWVDEAVRDGRVAAGHFDVRNLPEG